MIRLLELAAATAPDSIAVVTDEHSLTWAELLGRSREVAGALAERQISRFAIVEHDAGIAMALLAGAALAGAEPCQFQPDTDPAELAAQLAQFDHRTVVSRREDIGAAIVPADLASDRPVLASDAQPLLIRTTGTTGVPKGARHDWSVLSSRVTDATPRPDQRWLLTYGLHQFAGIQMLLHAVSAQASLVAPFPRQPRDGAEALLKYGVTCVSATPTYWRFLLAHARSAGMTLPALEQITLGGEAVPSDLLTQLRETFPEARISQVYASTELGSVVSVTDGRPGIGVDKLHSDANPEGTLRIVDGELWVRGSAGMLGYVDEEDTGVHADGEDAWRPTGDRVEIVGDRIEFRGRDSEVINVGGVKIHPLPVEEAVLSVSGVVAARVYGRANRLTGAIVAADVVLAPEGDPDDVRIRIRDAVSSLPRAAHPRSITFVDELETLGGKTIRRSEE
jgi:acyl-CoA synthetase (AMP-forming)/AMP-acid ligase II